MIQYVVPSPVTALLLLVALSGWAYRRHWRRDTGRFVRSRHALLALTVWGWVCCTPVLVNKLIVALEGPLPAGERTAARDGQATVIVLGSGEMARFNGLPSPRLDLAGWERLQGGVALWRRTGGTLVFTGGPNGLDEPTVAGLMGRVAAEWGVPAESIGLAVNSRTTQEDLRAAKALLHGTGPVWIVTSAMHMPRTLAVARRLGIEAHAHPVDYRQLRNPGWRAWLPDNTYAVLSDVCHELGGRLYYRWKGWSD